ncbi:MAG: TPM domain-containing protein [Frankiaceae bacterium]|nr:TPM domain-containing protein [Frankiaceae bacterium]MBV9872607.1 TPM domain-containing protein [Frankiaceae bacterium]
MSTLRRWLPVATLIVTVSAPATVALADAGAGFPEPSGYLVDAANQIPDAQQQALETELEAYADRSGHQLAVAVVDSTGGASIENYANDLFGYWGVGSAARDDGVLIVVATGDRQLRIEVGRGLEPELTDIEAADVVREQMVPRLQDGDLVGAIRDGERAVRRDLGDTAPNATGGGNATDFSGFGGGEAAPQHHSGFSFVPLLPLLVIGFILLTSIGRRRGRRGGFFPIFVGTGWGGGWGGGGWSGGGGGGGFGGFGGGSSGGGGASGSW